MQDNKTPLDEVTQIQALKALNAEEQLEEQKLAHLTEIADVSMKRIPVLALILTAILFGYYLSSFTSFFPLTGETENWAELRGQFGALGDFFGGLLNPVLSFFTIVLLIISLRVQMGELSLSRKELKRTRLAHEQQLEDARQAVNATRGFYNEQLNYLREQNKLLKEQATQAQCSANLQAKESNRRQDYQYQASIVELIDRQSAIFKTFLDSCDAHKLHFVDIFNSRDPLSSDPSEKEIAISTANIENAMCEKFELIHTLKIHTIEKTVYIFHLRTACNELTKLFNLGYFKGPARSDRLNDICNGILKSNFEALNEPCISEDNTLIELKEKISQYNSSEKYIDELQEPGSQNFLNEWLS